MRPKNTDCGCIEIYVRASGEGIKLEKSEKLKYGDYSRSNN